MSYFNGPFSPFVQCEPDLQWGARQSDGKETCIDCMRMYLGTEGMPFIRSPLSGMLSNEFLAAYTPYKPPQG